MIVIDVIKDVVKYTGHSVIIPVDGLKFHFSPVTMVGSDHVDNAIASIAGTDIYGARAEAIFLEALGREA